MKRTVLLVGLTAALALAFWGCSLLGVSIEDRVYRFVAGLNGDRSTLYQDFHPTETAYYPAIMASAVYFNIVFPPGPPDYTISGLNTSDPRNVTATIDGGGAGFGGPLPITFRMAQMGNDWLIEELDLGGVNIVQ